MPVVTRRELLEAGVHFGHQTRRWNPKMQRYLFGERSGIYIIDLEQSLSGLEEAHEFVQGLGRRRGIVLFIGTKKQAQEVVEEHAGRVRMPFVNNRWLGGMLTNFSTIRTRLLRLRELAEMEETGAMERLPKKEAIRLRHEREKLQRNLGGIQDLERLPDAVFVIDTKKEHIAVTEARKLNIPVIAIVDTNCDPDEVDYVIPGNDDAMRAISLYASGIADSVIEGRSQAPAVAVGEDEFVELDENGNPRKKGARSAPPKAPPPQRGRRPANTGTRRRPVVASVAADPEDGADPAVFVDTGDAAPRSATASAGRSRTGTGNAPGRGRGGGGGPRRG
jgi:small subunit ribosomal protein S2